jgi:hypothetical protein
VFGSKKSDEAAFMTNEDAAWEAAKAGLAASGAKPREEDRAQGWMVWRRGWSMSSWGETITVRFRNDGEGRVAVHVESRSQMRTTLVDWGRNRKNVRTVIETMKRQLAVAV